MLAGASSQIIVYIQQGSYENQTVHLILRYGPLRVCEAARSSLRFTPPYPSPSHSRRRP